MTRNLTSLSLLLAELGLGEDQPKSATQPTKLMPLAGMKVLE